mmetsp:Transcript_2771/g.8364  ORF Transcript_2771/g.8364 Transcript_2771/m.8364 type:complete len:268 (-) Transcript_2771:159-962(-)
MQPVDLIRSTPCVVISSPDTWQRNRVSVPSLAFCDALATSDRRRSSATKSFARSSAPVIGDGGRRGGQGGIFFAASGWTLGSQNDVRASSDLWRSRASKSTVFAVSATTIAWDPVGTGCAKFECEYAGISDRAFLGGGALRVASFVRSKSKRSRFCESALATSAARASLARAASQASRAAFSSAVLATMCSSKHSFEYTCPDGVQTGFFAGSSDSAQWPKGSCESEPVRASCEPMKSHFLRSECEKTPYVDDPLFLACFCGMVPVVF